MTDPDIDRKLEYYKKLATLQFYRINAILGALIAAIVVEATLLIIVTILDVAIPSGIILPLRGIDVPILRLSQVILVARIIFECSKLALEDEPELRKVEQ